MENKRKLDHFNIDKDQALQEMAIVDIRASLPASGNPELRPYATKRKSSKTVRKSKYAPYQIRTP